MSENGTLKRLKIEAYKDEKFNDPVGGTKGVFETSMNPDKYTFHFKIEQDKTQASGTSGAAPKFSKQLPEDLELEIMFDRTGVLEDSGPTEKGVMGDIDHLKEVIFTYEGDKHKPNYLKITWGALLFKGTLTELNIEFKLFKPDGAPIRAVAKGKFTGFMEDKLRVAKENNKSPDLTHMRTVRDGDTLPLMTFRIYGDSKYYLEVARVNNLSNFRKLVTGTQIMFPPVKKQS